MVGKKKRGEACLKMGYPTNIDGPKITSANDYNIEKRWRKPLTFVLRNSILLSLDVALQFEYASSGEPSQSAMEDQRNIFYQLHFHQSPPRVHTMLHPPAMSWPLPLLTTIQEKNESEVLSPNQQRHILSNFQWPHPFHCQMQHNLHIRHMVCHLQKIKSHNQQVVDIKKQIYECHFA